MCFIVWCTSRYRSVLSFSERWFQSARWQTDAPHLLSICYVFFASTRNSDKLRVVAIPFQSYQLLTDVFDKWPLALAKCVSSYGVPVSAMFFCALVPGGTGPPHLFSMRYVCFASPCTAEAEFMHHVLAVYPYILPYMLCVTDLPCVHIAHAIISAADVS